MFYFCICMNRHFNTLMFPNNIPNLKYDYDKNNGKNTMYFPKYLTILPLILLKFCRKQNKNNHLHLFALLYSSFFINGKCILISRLIRLMYYTQTCFQYWVVVKELKYGWLRKSFFIWIFKIYQAKNIVKSKKMYNW